MINEAVRDVLKERYLHPGEKDEFDMFRRVSEAITKGLKTRKKEFNKTFYDAMEIGAIMPNSPALMNLGTDNPMASACFVVPVEDSMDGIFNAIHDAAIVHKLGGGTGFCFSTLRPANSLVKTTGGKASGPLSFLKVFDVATGTVKQAGKRRGANMATFMCDHPDLIEFINLKDKDGDISNFNLSVMLTNDFMKAVEDDKNWNLKWKDKIYKTMKARDVFDMIVHQAWKNGEPGVLFIDTINSETVPEGFEKEHIISTNPCGEQPLESYGSCNLAAINLGLMVKKNEKDQYIFDDEKFNFNVELIITMLDLILDVCKFPLPEIEKKSLQTKRIGAGIMGFADLLIKLQIKYGSPECIELIHHIMKLYKEKAESTSKAIGNGKRKHKALLTIAPTGTTSMFCNASSGIEPYFNFWHERIVNDKKVLVFEGIVSDRITADQKEYIKKCFETNTPVDSSLINLPDYFIKASQIPWQQHVEVQSVFQQYVDSSISKTINMANSATEEDVASAIITAWQLKCKGVTVYRDGSRDKQVLSNIGSKKIDDFGEPIVKGEITLPQEMNAKTYRIKASLGREEPDQSFYIHIGLIKERPVQLFIDYKRQSDNANEVNQLKAQMIESLGMSISYQMRYGVPLTVIIKQLNKIPFSWMLSLHVQISKILEKYLDSNTGVCEKCKGKIEWKEGCKTCPCGYSNGCDH